MKLFVTRTLLCTTALIAPIAVHAQSLTNPAGLPPARAVLDGNGVDLATGSFNVSRSDVTIGPAGAGGIGYGVTTGSTYGAQPSTAFSITGANGYVYVTAGAQTDVFTQSGSTYSNAIGRGTQLIQVNTAKGPATQYIGVDGTTVTFPGLSVFTSTTSTIQRPSGEIETYFWENNSYQDQNFCTPTPGDPPCPTPKTHIIQRLQGISTNRGYALKFDYALSGAITYSNHGQWLSQVAVSAVNLATTSCDVTGDATCSTLPGTRTTTYGSAGAGVWTVANPRGDTTDYTFDAQGRIQAVKLPASQSNDIVVTYGPDGRVQYIDRPQGRWTYGYSLSGTQLTTTVTDPTNRQRVVLVDTTVAQPLSDTVAGRRTVYVNDSYGRLKTATAPEGNSVSYMYDAHGNVPQTMLTAKSGGGAITTSAVYPCASVNTCNKPSTTTDARGAVTNYAYNPDGTLQSVTAPAGANGVQPQVRYAYQSVAPSYWQRFSYNDFHQASNGAITVLQTVSTCMTQSGAGCVGTAGEVRATYGYSNDPNALPTALGMGAPSAVNSGATTATLNYVYTNDGDVSTASGPIAGMATRNYYDALRRVVGVVGAGPNPASGKYPAMNTIYDGNGRVTSVQQGTASDQSNAPTLAWLATQANAYDPTTGRLSSTTLSGSTTASTTNYGYDQADRLTTTTLLMQGQGSNRTTTNAYDANGLLSTVTTASNTADASTITYGYTGNGKPASIQDGNGNITRYAYDGFDRPQTTSYADGSTEVLALDNNGNATTRKLRDGQSISYGYDALNLLTSRSGPGLSNGYSYDNLGDLTSATGGSYNVSRTYDALGHMLTDTTGGFAMLNDFDAAGRRTGEHWATSGGYIRFQYAPTGAMSAITDANGTSWVAFTNDDLGRRTNVSYLNGRSTAWTYGPDLRLASLTHHMAGGPGTGTQNDVSYGFGYNPAGQITSRSTSNDGYVFSPVPRDASVTPNALNQPSPAASFAYDARGNQIATAAAPARASTFRIDDLPLSVSVSGKSPDILGYDALDRLASIQVGSGGPVTRLVWNGNELAGELDAGGNLQGLYARGGSDEPMVWWTPSSGIHVFHADERGSIVALTALNGQVERIHSYDAYGREGAAAHLGRFGYTGAIALPEAGLVHMRARAYDPALGRFLSADPIGTDGGINLYGYAGGDPVNAVDPQGLADEILVTGTLPGVSGGGGGSGYSGGSSGATNSHTKGIGGPDDAIVVTGTKHHRPVLASFIPVIVNPLTDLSNIIESVGERLQRYNAEHACAVVKVAAGLAEAGGAVIPEVSFKYQGLIARFDLGTKGVGGLGITEVKTYEGYLGNAFGALRRNQGAVAEGLANGQAVPFGANAQLAGFVPNRPLGRPIPFSVVAVHRPACDP